VLTLPAVLTHAASAAFARGLPQALQSQPAEVVADASALQQFDSSALAVLLECRRQAMAAGKAFAVHGAPARLRELAGLYGVEALISAGATAAPVATA
jgi:phospholipid transport system transporter-binding protein